MASLWNPETPIDEAAAAFSHAVLYAAGSIGAKLKKFICVEDAPYNAVDGAVYDQTTKFAAAIAAAGTHATIYAPGHYKANLSVPDGTHVEIIGDNMLKSDITAYTIANPVITVNTNNGSWAMQLVLRDIGLRGDATLVGDGVSTGTLDTANQLSGRMRFERVLFINFNRCFRKASGNIGNAFVDCVFSTSNFHIHAKDSPGAMPAGIDWFYKCHFDFAILASVHYNSSYAPSSQVAFRDCVFEQNPGFVFYVTSFSSQDMAPTFVVESCYFETNSTGGPNVLGTPVQGYFHETGTIQFIDCPLETFNLLDSSVLADRCHGRLNFDPGVQNDSNSVFRCRDYHDFGGSGGNHNAIIESVMALERNAGAFRGALWMPHPSKISFANQANILLSESFTYPVAFSGATTTDVLGGVVKDKCQRLTFAASNTLGGLFSPTVGRYVVIKLIAKLVSGNAPNVYASVGGNAGVIGPLANTDFKTLAFYTKSTSTATIGLMVVPDGATAIDLDWYEITEWPTEQEAILCINSPILHALNGNFPRAQYPGVSADIGDAAITLYVEKSKPTNIFATAITADRAVTLDTTNAWQGAKLRIVRKASCTGAFNINVGTGPLKAMGTAGSYCDVEYTGTAWILTAYGVL